MFDYLTTQADITELLQDMGVKVTLLKFTGGNVKTFAIWGKSESKATDALITVESKTIYLSGAIKKTPEVGDSIVIGASNWSVDAVEAYKPASTVIAYKVTVSQ